MPNDNRDYHSLVLYFFPPPATFPSRLATTSFIFSRASGRRARDFRKRVRRREEPYPPSEPSFIKHAWRAAYESRANLIHAPWLVNFEHREIFAFSIHGCIVLSATMRLTERKRGGKRKGGGKGTFMVERWKVTWKCLKIIIG